jgi:hypothetical protein
VRLFVSLSRGRVVTPSNSDRPLPITTGTVTTWYSSTSPAPGELAHDLAAAHDEQARAALRLEAPHLAREVAFHEHAVLPVDLLQ